MLGWNPKRYDWYGRIFDYERNKRNSARNAAGIRTSVFGYKNRSRRPSRRLRGAANVRPNKRFSPRFPENIFPEIYSICARNKRNYYAKGDQGKIKKHRRRVSLRAYTFRKQFLRKTPPYEYRRPFSTVERYYSNSVGTRPGENYPHGAKKALDVPGLRCTVQHGATRVYSARIRYKRKGG